MSRPRSFFLPAAALLLSIFFATLSQAAITAEQRKELQEIGTLVTKAGNAFVQKKYDEAGTTIKDAQDKMAALAKIGDKQVLDALSPLHGRILKAHALLELEGITLPALPKLDEMAGDAPASNPKNPGANPGNSGKVSFVSQIAPILNAKCGRCHVQDNKGMFSIASYDAFNRSPAANVMLEKIESGEMPKGNNKLTAEELALMQKWWAEGTKFDGADARTPLPDLKPGGTTPTSTTPADNNPAKPTGKETVSFSADVAPVLAQHCVGCHGDQRPRENFSVFTYDRLMKGGDAGVPVTPGKPNDSLLIMKLEGKAADGARMPLNKDPLPTTTIAKIRKWIEEGAKFDGPDAKMDVVRVAALAKAAGSTHEQLSAERVKLADEQWRLVMPGIEADKAETGNFLVLGNIGPNTLKEIADSAEALTPKVGEIFKAPEGPLVKGRLTMFVFRQRYDYSEFGKMVERRDVPPDSRGHWKFAVVEAYGALVQPKSNEFDMQPLIAEQLAGVYISSLGKNTPHWFAEGCGRVAATKINAKDPRVASWDAKLPQVVGEMPSSDAFLTGKMGGEETDIASYSFVKFLMGDSKKFNMLLDGLKKNGDFTQVFSATYGGSPNQVADAWYRRGGKK